MSLTCFTLAVFIALTTSEINYGSTCGYPQCLRYFDGCNNCFCSNNGDDGTFQNYDDSVMACTRMFCIRSQTPYCKECAKGSYWLSSNSFQPPGHPTCDMQFVRSATFAQNNSKCGCPESHPFYYEGIGCIKPNDCPSGSIGGKIEDPSSVQPFELRQTSNGAYGCSYEYRTCNSHDDCDNGFICNIPKNNYETCIPLMAKLDQNCEIRTSQCSKCTPNDCMGTGYGYCVKSRDCQRTGCSNQICSSEEVRTTCENKCEYQCLDYLDCRRHGTDGQCAFAASRDRADHKLWTECREKCRKESEYSSSKYI